jgi:hypothetical protein
MVINAFLVIFNSDFKKHRGQVSILDRFICFSNLSIFFFSFLSFSIFKNDLAIVVFDQDETRAIMDMWGNIPGFNPASIVPPNFLSDLKKKDLKMLEVKNVGYGSVSLS